VPRIGALDDDIPCHGGLVLKRPVHQLIEGRIAQDLLDPFTLDIFELGAEELGRGAVGVHDGAVRVYGQDTFFHA